MHNLCGEYAMSELSLPDGAYRGAWGIDELEATVDNGIVRVHWAGPVGISNVTGSAGFLAIIAGASLAKRHTK